MVATAFSNVINPQENVPQSTNAPNGVIFECRDVAARRLREALREMFKSAGESLLRRGDASKENDERRFLYALNDRLSTQGGRLEGLLVAHWRQGFDAALKGVSTSTNSGLPDEMQIVDYSEMDESLAVKAMARRLQDKCDENLYALGQRFGFLIGKESDLQRDNPMSPEYFVNALQDALQESGFDTRSRQELYRFLEGCIDVYLGPVYHVTNAHLLERNVLPNLKRGYGRVVSQAPRQPAEKMQSTGDVFSVLQSLLLGNTTGEVDSPARGMAGAMAGFPGQGMGVPVHVMHSLDAMQFADSDSVGVQPSASQIANVLHDFRASEVGQGLGQLDAITVDIVAMLFDMIFDDKEMSDPIKVLVGKLQIPVLKVAMLDRGFFSSKAHPTRHLLDLISQAALRWSRQVDYEDPVYQKIAEVIDHIHDNFKQDTALFEMHCRELERFFATHEDAVEGNVHRAAVLVARRELEELADIATDCELSRWQDIHLPRAVIDLMDHEWRALLRQIHLQEGGNSDAWNNALATAADLVDSVQPKHDVQQRQALARQLPLLVKQLSAGFDFLNVNSDRRSALLDALFPLHAASLRGIEPSPVADGLLFGLPPVANEPDIESHSLGDGEVTVESISVTTPHFCPAASQDVANLRRGDWIEYIQADGGAIRYRLSWISPKRGIFLFTNSQSPHALAVSPEAMGLQVQRGEVRILSTEPIFDRALTRTIDVLQAA